MNKSTYIANGDPSNTMVAVHRYRRGMIEMQDFKTRKGYAYLHTMYLTPEEGEILVNGKFGNDVYLYRQRRGYVKARYRKRELKTIEI